MDNFRIDITAEGDTTLAAALKIAFDHNAPGRKCGHYKVVNLLYKTSYWGDMPDGVRHSSNNYEDAAGRPVLLLLWHEERGSTKHPFEMNLDETVAFVRGWLRNADYGRQPDHDGDNGRGFRLFTENWGHVAGYSYTICAIEPMWACYGK